MRNEGLCLHLQNSSFVCLLHTLSDDLRGLLCVCVSCIYSVFGIVYLCSVFIPCISTVYAVSARLLCLLLDPSSPMSIKKILFRCISIYSKTACVCHITLDEIKSVSILMISYYQCDPFVKWNTFGSQPGKKSGKTQWMLLSIFETRKHISPKQCGNSHLMSLSVA